MTESLSTEEFSASPGKVDDPVSDEALLAQWRESGTHEPVTKLVQRYLKPVRRYVFQMVLHDATADDLTQEVFLRAVRGLNGFAGHSKFSTWLFQIASNVTFTHLSTVQKKRTEPLEAPLRKPDREAQPVQHLIQQETFSAIEPAMNKLSPKLRSALMLTCLHGKSAEEVSEIEGCEVGTIYSRVHEARKQLKRSLGDLLP